MVTLCQSEATVTASACLQSLTSFPLEAGEMTEWVKALASKPEDLSLIPGSHMVEGENLHKVVLWFQPYVYTHTSTHKTTHINTYNKIIYIWSFTEDICRPLLYDVVAAPLDILGFGAAVPWLLIDSVFWQTHSSQSCSRSSLQAGFFWSLFQCDLSARSHLAIVFWLTVESVTRLYGILQNSL